MKIAPSADYYVQVRPQEWEEEGPTAHLYAGIFGVYLNYTVHVVFIPDFSGVAPPWNAPPDPPMFDEKTPVDQVRLYEALTSTYVVTPNEALAGTEERFVWPADGDPQFPTVIFYVTSAEFARYSAELDQLSEIVGGLRSFTRVSDLRGHEVIDLMERRIVPSSWLNPLHAATLGQAR